MTLWDWLCLAAIVTWAFWPRLRYWYALYKVGPWSKGCRKN